MAQHRSALDAKISVTGMRDRHLGPRSERASVSVSVEAAERFELVNLTGDIAAEREGYIDRFVQALLNHIAAASSVSPSKIRLTIESIEHDFESSLMAFQRAGEDAGRKIIDAIRSRPGGVG